MGELAEEWLARRKKTHRAWADDTNRWNRHLKKFFGGCRPSEVDAAGIRRFVEAKLGELNPATVGHCVRMLSTFFTDLVERGLADKIPCARFHAQPEPSTSRRRSRSTPFIEKLDNIRRVFQGLPEPINVAFGIGAFGGLRTGEVLGLSWEDSRSAGRRITVRKQMYEGELVGLKDDESRLVPIQDALLTILTEYKLKSGGEGLLFRAGWHGLRGGTATTKPTYMRSHTLHRYLKMAFEACKLKPLTWYHSTRHTFASQWVIAGGSMEKLSGDPRAQLSGGHAALCHLRLDHLPGDRLPHARRRPREEASRRLSLPVQQAFGVHWLRWGTIAENTVSEKQLDASHAPLKNSPTRL